jgi:hypothetical protein
MAQMWIMMRLIFGIIGNVMPVMQVQAQMLLA